MIDKLIVKIHESEDRFMQYVNLIGFISSENEEDVGEYCIKCMYSSNVYKNYGTRSLMDKLDNLVLLNKM